MAQIIQASKNSNPMYVELMTVLYIFGTAQLTYYAFLNLIMQLPYISLFHPSDDRESRPRFAAYLRKASLLGKDFVIVFSLSSNMSF